MCRHPDYQPVGASGREDAKKRVDNLILQVQRLRDNRRSKKQFCEQQIRLFMDTLPKSYSQASTIMSPAPAGTDAAGVPYSALATAPSGNIEHIARPLHQLTELAVGVEGGLSGSPSLGYETATASATDGANTDFVQLDHADTGR